MPHPKPETPIGAPAGASSASGKQRAGAHIYSPWTAKGIDDGWVGGVCVCVCVWGGVSSMMAFGEVRVADGMGRGSGRVGWVGSSGSRGSS